MDQKHDASIAADPRSVLRSQTLVSHSPANSLLELLAEAWPPSRWQDVHVVVACSGGADSSGLLRSMLALKPPQSRGKLIAAHVNHRLRGEAGDADARWLAELADRLGIEWQQRTIDAKIVLQREGLESAARQARYRLLAQIAHEAGARYVALGHTRDDQTETVLFRILRGTGWRGLAGIPTRRPLSPSVMAIRPLLGATREQIRAALQHWGQDWREDETNRHLCRTRNRLRRQLLPYLRRRFNSRVDDSLARLADQAQGIGRIVDEAVERLLPQIHLEASPGTANRKTGSRESGGSFSLEVAALAEVDAYLTCEVLRHAWGAAQLPEQSMTWHHWRQLACLTSGADGSLQLPGPVLAERRHGRLVVRDVS